MEKLYDRIFWENNTTPALNDSNLNSMSKALDDIDDRLVNIAGDVMEVVPQIQSYLAQADSLVEALETLSQNPPYIGANGNWWVWDTSTSEFVDSGIDASITVQIADITMLEPNATPYITNSGTNTDPIFHLFIPRGYKGDTGNGISTIAKTGTVGLIDTYTITYTDGTSSTFTVTNGARGTDGSTPNITMSATADNTSSVNPSVLVTKSGTVDNPIFALAFSGLKGQQGVQGEQGQTGSAGNGIISITKTGQSGLVDTYTILYTNGNSDTFTVTNGQDGQGSGDMTKLVYDSDNAVADAGGIAAYVASHSRSYTGEKGVVVDGITIKAALKSETMSSLASENISTTQNRQYAVGLDSNGKLSVNVPWENTIPTVDQVYDSSSANAQSGIAVAGAISGKADAECVESSLFEVSTSNWVQDTTSQSGSTLYKKTITLTNVYKETPNVSISASSGLPTTAQQTAYDLIKYVTVDSAIPCLYLYATAVPSDSFYINVEGVD